VVQGLLPAPGGGDGYPQVLLDLVLAGKVVEGMGTEAAIEVDVLDLGLTRNNTLYLLSPSLLIITYIKQRAALRLKDGLFLMGEVWGA
jgi:hypothetical protein